MQESKRQLTPSPISTPAKLTADAFSIAVEIKQSDTALPALLKSIYLDKKPDYDYLPIQGSDQPFRQQLQLLMGAIHSWAQENKLDETAQLNITNFNDYLFAAAGEKQAPIYFIDIKKNLEKIMSLLKHPDIAPLRKKSQLAELASNLTMCGPGLYRHIESTCQALESPVSLSHWLAEHRTNLIYLYAEKHITEQKIDPGNSIHVHNVFLLHAVKKSWAPLTKITNINEHFTSLAKVTPAILQDFEIHFLTQFNIRSIVDFLCTSFIAELNRQRKQLVGDVSAKSEGIPFDTKIMELKDSLLANLDLKFDSSIFDQNEEEGKIYIKFNAKLFKQCLLKQWHEINFSSSILIYFWKYIFCRHLG